MLRPRDGGGGGGKNFFLFLNQNIIYVFGTQKNSLTETGLLRTQNTCLN